MSDSTLTVEELARRKEALEIAQKSTQEKVQYYEAAAKALDLERQMAEQADQSLKATFLANEQRLVDIQYKEQILKLERETIQETINAGHALDDLQKKRLRDIQTQEEVIKRQLEAARAIEATESQTKNLINSLTGVGDQWKETFIGGFITAGQTVGGLQERMTRFRAQLRETLTVSNMLAAGLSKIAQGSLALAREQDNAIATFNKATSTMGEYSGQLIGIERANVHLGVSTEEAAAAFGTLLTNVTTFPQATPALQRELATTVAHMQELGVSTQLTARTMEEAMLVLGLSETAAMGLTNSLADMAVQMNLPIEQVTENFNAAMPVLAKFGKDAPDVFKKVQVASRSLGVEVGQLLQVMGQFDTFDGAAQAAGKLNAILGGDLLNSAELLQANEAERLRMVRESIAMSGRQFDSMGRFEKMAVANALGVQDISTATKMLSGDMDRFGDALDASGLTKEETEARIQATQSITEKLANTWRMFAISMRPVVNVVHSLMDGIFLLNERAHGILVPIMAAVTALYQLNKVFGLTRLSALMTWKAMGPLLLLAGGFTLGKVLAEFLDVQPETLKMIGAGLTILAGAAAAFLIASSGGLAGMPIAAGLAAVFGGAGIGMLSTDFTGADDGGDFEFEGFQEGGPVKAGRPILVGEGGTEVFVPGADGAIRRNEDFQRMQSIQPQQAPVASSAASQKRDMTVVIQLDKRELGRATIKAIEDVPGYNFRGSLEYA